MMIMMIDRKYMAQAWDSGAFVEKESYWTKRDAMKAGAEAARSLGAKRVEPHNLLELARWKVPNGSGGVVVWLQ